MNEEYLWDKSGAPDPEIRELENLLSPLRYNPPVPVVPRKRAPARITWFLAAAAALVVALIAGRQAFAPKKASVWSVASSGQEPKKVFLGQVVETGPRASVTLQSDFVGQLTLDPQSRLRVESASKGRELLSLQHGTLHALIWAPPAQFVVQTPSARTTDLGCAYTLQVDEKGYGTVEVEAGWVAFDWRGVESFIPAGAACSTRPNRGPGIPYFRDASPEFRRALNAVDQESASKPLETVLGSARQRDALSLWHLMKRVPPESRGMVFDRFVQLVQLPASISRDRVIRGDQVALDEAWDALGFGNTGWWRTWRQDW